MYIYCWQDRRYYAIAIGKASNPEIRMHNFAEAARLIVRHGTLREHKLKPRTDARLVLDAVHVAVRSLGLSKIEGMKELYTLKGNLYEPIASAVMRAAAAAEREVRLDAFGPEPEARQGDRARNEYIK
jgi:hypothetical protein